MSSQFLNSLPSFLGVITFFLTHLGCMQIFHQPGHIENDLASREHCLMNLQSDMSMALSLAKDSTYVKIVSSSLCVMSVFANKALLAAGFHIRTHHQNEVYYRWFIVLFYLEGSPSICFQMSIYLANFISPAKLAPLSHSISFGKPQQLEILVNALRKQSVSSPYAISMWTAHDAREVK